jgi:hypothetical protein
MNKQEQIQPLLESFSKNGLPYRLIKRNNVVALYGVGGTYYPTEQHYEVIRIIQVPEKNLFGKTIPAHEAIPGNGLFGREGSRSIVYLERAEDYFLELTDKLKSRNEGPNDLSMEENSTQVYVDTTPGYVTNIVQAKMKDE